MYYNVLLYTKIPEGLQQKLEGDIELPYFDGFPISRKSEAREGRTNGITDGAVQHLMLPHNETLTNEHDVYSQRVMCTTVGFGRSPSDDGWGTPAVVIQWSKMAVLAAFSR